MKKNMFITGAASGIGEGLSRYYADKGYNLMLFDIDASKGELLASQLRENGAEAKFIQMDVSDKASVEQAMEEATKSDSRIDVFINSAGISVITPFLDHSEELWDKTLDINLKGMFLCNQEVIKRMLEYKAGTIVNFSSQSGKVGTNNYAAYCASKFGIIGLSQSIAREFAHLGIRCNVVCPGVVDTPMWSKQRKKYGEKRNIDENDVFDYFAQKNPTGRIGTIDDVANVVDFLISEKSSYITGQSINVNGGDIMF